MLRESMGSTFNPQILVEKLSKLNSSQASIETLSHWCIFHMNKAKQVVETWERQFHHSPRDQRVAFLYLANDILQNSRRKGVEFVNEFLKVLPDALRDVIENCDDFGRNAALRMINIWEDRKVFGSRGQILKEEIVGRHPQHGNRNGKQSSTKLKRPPGNMVDKIVSGFFDVYSGPVDEDDVLDKCKNAINSIEKVDTEISGDVNSGSFHEGAIMDELRGQNAVLIETIDQLVTFESSRESLISHLREALQEQESKLEQVRVQLQAARSHSEHAENICQRLLRSNSEQLVAERSSKDANTSGAPPSFISGDGKQSAPPGFLRQVSFPDNTGHTDGDPRKSAAAAMAAKLTASTSSAQMLSYVLSSLASESVNSNSAKESFADYSSEKRAKLDNDQSYIPTHNPLQPPIPPFQQSEAFRYNVTTADLPSVPLDPPPPPSSPPPVPPPPPGPYSVPQYMPSTGSVSGVPYGYGMSQQQAPLTVPSYSPVGTQMTGTGISPYSIPPANSYQSYQAGSEGNMYSQPSSMPLTPVSRQQ